MADAIRDGLRLEAIAGDIAGDGDTGMVEDDDTSDVEPRAAAIATVATSTPAPQRLRIRIRPVVGRAGLLRVTPPLKAAWCCRHVCGFRYADDMCRLVRTLARRSGRPALRAGSPGPAG